MYLKSIKLINFRNFSKLNFQFQTPITILMGDNAKGKSNFLESVYFLSTTKSTRAEKEEELIRYGQDHLRVEGEVGNGKLTIEDGQLIKLDIAALNQEGNLKKKVKVNGIPRRVIDYSANLAVVMFAPSDINLVTGAPSLRRAHLDQTLSQIDRSYKKAVVSYEDIIIRKNKLLKAIRDGFAQLDQLTFWSQEQLSQAQIICQKRRDFFDFLNATEKKLGAFEFEYLESLLSEQRLMEYQDREIEAATSLIGPHRDDFLFVILDSDRGSINKEKLMDSRLRGNDSGRDLSRFGSRGEQRTAVLDLKLSEVSFMESVLGNRPVLLLDDIFSELDIAHRQHVVDLAKLQQTIITTVEPDGFLKKAFQDAQIFKVENGQILPP